MIVRLRLPITPILNLPGTPKRSVVLIDEIDKAPRDVPNDILVELERLEFEIPELRTARQPVTGRICLESHENRYRPIVIITSNSEKALPDPFLRRCVYHHLQFPLFIQAEGEQSDEIVTVEDIVASRLGSRYTNSGQLLVEQAISLFRYLREEGGRLERRPTLAELLDWLNFLLPQAGEGRPPASLLAMEEKKLINSLKHLLLKKPADQSRTAELWQAWRNTQDKYTK